MRRKVLRGKRLLLPALFILLLAALCAACAPGGGSPADTAQPALVSPSPAEASAPPAAETDAPAGDTVTMSISCAAILEHMDWLDPDKAELIPEDGWILKPVTLPLEEGESVFDLLLRVTRQNKIHMEYSQSPMYGSAYIEGIHNLYEFDCGEVSGWMYSVNGWYPNYGCSGYVLKPGDVVEWRFTCDGGEDVGGGYMPEA